MKKTRFEKMAFYRTLLSYLYPKTRKKSRAFLLVVVVIIVILFSFQKTAHRKFKNETLGKESTSKIYGNFFEDSAHINNNNNINAKFSNNNDQLLNNLFKDGGIFSDKNINSAKVEYSSFNTTKPPDILYSALIFTDSERSTARDKLKFVFKSLKVNFDFITWNRFDDNYLTVPRLINKYETTRYHMIIFTNIQIFDNLDSFTRGVLQTHCKKFNIGMIILTRAVPNYGMRSRSVQLSSIPLTLMYGMDHRLEDIEIVDNPALNLVKSDNILKGRAPGDHHVIFQTLHSTFEPIAVAVRRNWRNLKMYDKETGGEVEKAAIILCDKGDVDGIRKVFFGVTFWESWLYQLILVDAMFYVSNSNFVYDGLKRYIQIDIDDVFVGKTGRRLIKEDVTALVAAQEYFSKKIAGFQFNLGFSSYHYKVSNNSSEVEGDQYILQKEISKKFRWFDHTSRHIKPHQHSEKELTKDFQTNQEFAKEHGFPVDHTYSVAPHHSGVYPVHRPLYSAWKKAFRVQVTSTEGYPHLYPANGRKGFMYDDIMVLPRQTCGLFTKTLSSATHPKGPTYLYDLTQGGELFWTIVFNPISLFMTHACNYGMKERLAIQLFTNVTMFVEKWTNIQLTSGTPVELAKKYFEIFPKQMEPLWTDPCTDLRHQKIWNKTEIYCNAGIRSTTSRLADILIVGPQKTGTTALLTFLAIHPDIVRSRRSNRSFEEVQFFNKNNYKKGLDWYIDFFPDRSDKGDQLYVDKSANYFDSLKAPQRAYSILPDVKIIVISTDPKLRAYSWYQHMRSKKDPIATSHTFYEVITGQIKNNTDAVKFWMLHSKCLLPGRYTEALERWLQYYNSSQILIVDGDELKDKPVVTLRKVQSFLGLSAFSFGKYIRYDTNKKFYCLHVDGKSRCLGKGKGRHYDKMKPEEEQFLADYYHIPNLRLNDLLRKIHKPLPRWLQHAVRDATSK